MIASVGVIACSSPNRVYKLPGAEPLDSAIFASSMVKTHSNHCGSRRYYPGLT